MASEVGSSFRDSVAARAHQYVGAEISRAFSVIDGGYSLIRGVIAFWNRPPPDRSQTMDIGPLQLERHFEPTESVSQPLLRMAEWVDVHNDLNDELNDALRFSGPPHSPNLTSITRPSWWAHAAQGLPNAIGEPRFFPWPSECYFLQTRDKSFADPPGPIFTTRIGVFPNPTALINEFIGADFTRWPGHARGYLVVLPDFRARIVSARVAANSLTMVVQTGTVPRGQLQFAATADEKEIHVPMEETEDAASGHVVVKVPITGAQFSLQFLVLDREADNLIDWMEVRANPYYFAPEIVYDQPGGQIARLISQGEGQNLEFKQEVGDGERITQSVVAFANGEGGTILVGVANDGSPTKVDRTAARQKIETAIRDCCDPLVSVTYEETELNGTPLLAVIVPRGQDAPYLHRRTGAIHIRRGASNFRATSQEVRELVARTQTPRST